jgi:hypothetical protein
MSSAAIDYETVQNSPLACIRKENSYRLMSLWDMIAFRPTIVTFWLKISSTAPWLIGITEEGWDLFRAKLNELRDESERYDFRSVPPQVAKILVQIGATGIPEIPTTMLHSLFMELGNRLREDMETPLLFLVPVSLKTYYASPCKGWEAVVDKYPSPQLIDDISEAGKCFATDRLTGCVFHLMRIVETAVLELYWLTGLPADEKAHFGSVVSKLEKLTQKTEFKDLPAFTKPHIGFLRDILPFLHAVKDAWRNRVSHVDGRILPTEGYKPEDVLELYMATRGLMKTMAAKAPPKASIIG